MPRRVDLISLYQAIFHKSPSALSMEALRALEHHLELTDNDPLGPLLIVLLRVTDQVAESQKELVVADGRHRAELREICCAFGSLIRDLNAARANALKKGLWRSYQTWNERGDVKVHAYRHRFPILNFLREAFEFRSGALEPDERIVAARWDLAFVSIVLAAVFAAGMLFGG